MGAKISLSPDMKNSNDPDEKTEKPVLSLSDIRAIMDQEDKEIYGFLTDAKRREFTEETGQSPKMNNENL